MVMRNGLSDLAYFRVLVVCVTALLLWQIWGLKTWLDTRNEAVCDYRKMLLDAIKAACELDHGEGWEDRYAAYDEVTYDTMVYQFWKPLSAFYSREQHKRMLSTKPDPA